MKQTFQSVCYEEDQVLIHYVILPVKVLAVNLCYTYNVGSSSQNCEEKEA